MNHGKTAEILADALRVAAEQDRFEPLLDGIREALELAGVEADRIQIPMSRKGGFRHPTLGLVLLTWSRDEGFAGTATLTHDELNKLSVHGVVGTPFEGVVLGDKAFERWALEEDDGGYEILAGMREKGYCDYCTVGLPVPLGDRQPMSIASRNPMPENLGDVLRELAPILALAAYAVYRTSQAAALARVYIGSESGPRVLAGDIQRGSTTRERAGILFCDVRGFTALSEELGAERVVSVVNQIFQIIGKHAKPRGGEILKFIGDAMLMTFSDVSSEAELATALIETSRSAVTEVDELAARLELPVAVGFGGHIGEVVRGNIGTEERLDFTVMGPAVNLTARLESLCRPLGAVAVFSGDVAQYGDLQYGGKVELKGIAEPQPVWVIPVET